MKLILEANLNLLCHDEREITLGELLVQFLLRQNEKKAHYPIYTKQNYILDRMVLV